jgi:hypothetical protein
MITLIVIGIAVTAVLVLLAATLARNAPRRGHRLAASGEHGAMPWIDAGDGSSNCDSGTASDVGCSDGGGGGGGN